MVVNVGRKECRNLTLAIAPFYTKMERATSDQFLGGITTRAAHRHPYE